MKKVIAIVGPTGVGKSDLGIKLAQKYNGEIISGDSIQVYRGLNIGSAKVTKEEMDNIPHHLIDTLDLKDNYNVYDFQLQARHLINEITSKGKLPIVVGGTGLYIKALLYDYEFEKEEKENIDETECDAYTNEEILEQLKKYDPKSANSIHVNNRKRLIRALKMAKSGKSKSEIVDAQEHKLVYDAKVIGLTVDRDLLYDRINQRVDKMIEQGLKKEVEILYVKDKDFFRRRGSQGIGYREWESYLKGLSSEANVIDEIKKHSRQFAKRQYTWFNNQMDIKWYDILEKNYQNEIQEDIEKWL